MAHRRIRYIDLFAGCGGLSDGFESTGRFEGIAHVDWEQAPCETLRQRLKLKWRCSNADRIVIQGDIQEHASLCSGAWHGRFPSHVGLDALVNEAKGVDLIIGGPPCQAYSVAGRIRDAHGMQFDYRNFLFESYLDVIKKYKPLCFVFENVPGMLSATSGGIAISKRVASAFTNAAYTIPDDFRECLIDMADFGVPQLRKRLIIVGFSTGVGIETARTLIAQLYGQQLPAQRIARRTSVLEAIGGLPKLLPIPGRTERKPSHRAVGAAVSDHEPRFHSKRDQKIFRKLARDLASDSPKLQGIDSIKALYRSFTGKDSSVHKYHVLRPTAPSNLIPAHLSKDGLRHIHFDPTQARSITVREAACLQGFPLDFCFSGSMGDRYRMIGNAVPPTFSACLARALDPLLCQVLTKLGRSAVRLRGEASSAKTVRRRRSSPKSR